MHNPTVLFLDEPTTGLDPAARLFVWDRIRELRDAGVTVVLTTHDMEEAATLADRVGIVDSGQLLALDSPSALIRGVAGGATLQVTVDTAGEHGMARLLARLADLPGVQRCERVAPAGAMRTLRLYLTGDAEALVAHVVAAIVDVGARLIGVQIKESSLEDVFIELTGRRLR
jgi:ABC-2 type transport system ATP-binding protein